MLPALVQFLWSFLLKSFRHFFVGHGHIQLEEEISTISIKIEEFYEIR